jgi:hypothetical protein
MSKEQVKAVLDRVLTWPSERQEDAAKLLMLMESQDESVYRLTDEQVEEVRRRRVDPNRKLISVAEASERLARLGGEADEAP